MSEKLLSMLIVNGVIGGNMVTLLGIIAIVSNLVERIKRKTIYLTNDEIAKLNSDTMKGFILEEYCGELLRRRGVKGWVSFNYRHGKNKAYYWVK